MTRPQDPLNPPGGPYHGGQPDPAPYGYGQQQPGHGPAHGPGQPDYGQAPGYGPGYAHAPSPGYGPGPEHGPGAPQPGYGQAPGFGPGPAPAPPKKRSGGRVVALVVGLFALVLLVGGAIFALPIIRESGATITTPDTIAGLTRDTSSDAKSTVDNMTRSVASGTKGKKITGALYREGEDNPVIFVGATGMVMFPGKEIEDAFREFDNVTDASDIDAGPLGGTIRCATASVGGIPSGACVWADHGSFGLAIFVNRDKASSATLFQNMRTAMQKR